jgi:hypothetical protein
MRAKLDAYRGLVQRTPGAEREVSEVLRRREVLQIEFQHAQDRLQSANLAESFESHQGGERFTLLRAPVVPRSPVFPNRVGLILLGLVFGVALTGIAVAIAESNDKKVRTTRIRPLLNDLPLLASIPYIRNTRDKRRNALMLSSFAAAYSVTSHHVDRRNCSREDSSQPARQAGAPRERQRGTQSRPSLDRSDGADTGSAHVLGSQSLPRKSRAG